jgi:hypothetical protein
MLKIHSDVAERIGSGFGSQKVGTVGVLPSVPNCQEVEMVLGA